MKTRMTAVADFQGWAFEDVVRAACGIFKAPAHPFRHKVEIAIVPDIAEGMKRPDLVIISVQVVDLADGLRCVNFETSAPSWRVMLGHQVAIASEAGR